MYMDRYWHEQELQTVSRFLEIAKEADIAPTRLAVAWVLAQPGVTCAILGASRVGQLPDLLAAEETVLDPALLKRLDELTRSFRKGDSDR
jgi:aryl-alcohol dehydrogenase (NADP+)